MFYSKFYFTGFGTLFLFIHHNVNKIEQNARNFNLIVIWLILFQFLLPTMVIYFDLQPVAENHLLDNLDDCCSFRVKFSSHTDMDMSVKVSNIVVSGEHWYARVCMHIQSWNVLLYHIFFSFFVLTGNTRTTGSYSWCKHFIKLVGVLWRLYVHQIS